MLLRTAAVSLLWRLCAATTARPPTAEGSFGMVATTQPFASRAGVTILEAGGTLLDAAVSVQLALAVVEPQHVSLLGGGTLLYKPMRNATVQIDFREEAPSRYHPLTFCKNTTCLLDPHCECHDGAWSSNERCTGGHAVGVPGVPALVDMLITENLLTLPLKELAAPAITLAEEGFPMYDFLHQTISAYAHLLKRDNAASEIFLNANRTACKVKVGEIFRQPLLAKTLRTFFTDERAVRSFYHGDLANEITAAARNAQNPVTLKYGLLESADLLNYKAVRRAPVHFTYQEGKDGKVYNVTSGALPFSGGATLGLILAQVQRLSLRTEDPTRRLGYFLDAQNAAFADRNKYLADPDFVDVPLHGLLSDSYADERLKELFPISKDSALHTPVLPGSPPTVGGHQIPLRHSSTTPDHGTSHFSLAHADGSVLAMTTTVNNLMGSRVAVPGRGMLLNNEMCDFDAVGIDKAGVMTVNAAEGGKRMRRSAVGPDSLTKGGKRPRSSMTPTIVEAPSGAAFNIMALGAPGGTDIIGGVANVLRQVLAPTFRMSALQNATDAPRAIGKNAKGHAGVVESALWNEAGVIARLHSLGYNLTHTAPPPYALGETFSRVESAMVAFTQSGVKAFAGAADSLRFPGAAAIAPSRGHLYV